MINERTHPHLPEWARYQANRKYMRENHIEYDPFAADDTKFPFPKDRIYPLAPEKGCSQEFYRRVLMHGKRIGRRHRLVCDDDFSLRVEPVERLHRRRRRAVRNGDFGRLVLMGRLQKMVDSGDQDAEATRAARVVAVVEASEGDGIALLVAARSVMNVLAEIDDPRLADVAHSAKTCVNAMEDVRKSGVSQIWTVAELIDGAPAVASRWRWSQW